MFKETKSWDFRMKISRSQSGKCSPHQMNTKGIDGYSIDKECFLNCACE